MGSDLPGVTSLGRYREPEPNAAKAEKKVPPKKAVKSSEEEDESSNSSESCFGSDCSDDEAGSSEAATAESCAPQLACPAVPRLVDVKWAGCL